VQRISALLVVFEKEVDDLSAELRTQYLAAADMNGLSLLLVSRRGSLILYPPLIDEGCCFRLRLAELYVPVAYSVRLISLTSLRQHRDV
jgi:hypothetical protein